MLAASRVVSRTMRTPAPLRAMATKVTGPSAETKAALNNLGVDWPSHIAKRLTPEEIETDPIVSSNEYLKRAAQRESNARGYVRKYPFAIQRAHGVQLEDTNGNTYLDCLGNAGTLALGHNHPVIVEALQDALASGAPQQVLDMATPLKDSFMDSLFSVLPDEFTRVHHCSPAGTDVLDAAVKLCKIATGRRTVVSFHGAYHGMGQATLAMMGNLGTKTPVPSTMPDVHFLPLPYAYRNPFGLEGEAGVDAVINYWENVLGGDDESGIPKPACVVIEPIQGEGGVQPVPARAFQALRRITEEQGIPLVIDEVQSGFCRSGDFFAYQESGIVPDVLCMSKALGGSMPMGAIAFKEDLNVWSPGAHTGTFRGNQLAFASGRASLEFMKSEKLWEHAAKMGGVLRERLDDLASQVDTISDVRGRGLMVGIEATNPNETDKFGLAARDGQLATVVQRRCIENGLICERGGRGGATMRFLPPLIIQEDDIHQAADIFAQSWKEAQDEVARARA